MDSTRDIQFKEQIKKSFSACRKDIESLQQLVYTQSTSISQLLEQSRLKDEKIVSLEQNLITNQSKFDALLDEISKLRDELSNASNVVETSSIKKEKVIEKEVKTESSHNSNQIKDPYEALLKFKAKLNKRDILKQKLLGMISNEGMILSELKFLFVEHFKYCSKATFYNYLKELELSKQVRIERENSKNMIYVSGNVSQINSELSKEIDF